MQRRESRAFTLVEMLVVISIIAILASILLPTVAAAKVKAQIRRVHTEVKLIEQAIISYHSTYNRYPVSGAVMNAAAANNEDFTYGGDFKSSPPPLRDAASGFTTNVLNSEVIAILMDMENYPNGGTTINAKHVKNPQQIKFLNAKLSGASPPGGNDPGLPGVDLGGTYRDPWGYPYIISMDLNYDERCWDALYRLRNVSQNSGSSGLEGLYNATAKDGSGNLTGGSDHFAFNGGVMVWSAGPDRRINFMPNPNPPPPYGSANVGDNRDNVLSWK